MKNISANSIKLQLDPIHDYQKKKKKFQNSLIKNEIFQLMNAEQSNSNHIQKLKTPVHQMVLLFHRDSV